MIDPHTPPVVLVCSVALESDPLRAAMQDVHPLAVGRKPALAGRLGAVPVILLVAGMGKTNAAAGLAVLLETRPVGGVVGFGVGGAYPGSGLATGAVALASAEVYGDEGVETPDGWISTEGIGIPLLDQDGARCFNHFALDEARVAAARQTLEGAGISVVTGPFVTVSCCSGTGARGTELARRFGAVCETMEGAAYAHVAALYGVPYLGVRGISNQVEDRDLSGWRLRDAAEAAAAAAAHIVSAPVF